MKNITWKAKIVLRGDFEKCNSIQKSCLFPTTFRYFSKSFSTFYLSLSKYQAWKNIIVFRLHLLVVFSPVFSFFVAEQPSRMSQKNLWLLLTKSFQTTDERVDTLSRDSDVSTNLKRMCRAVSDRHCLKVKYQLSLRTFSSGEDKYFRREHGKGLISSLNPSVKLGKSSTLLNQRMP